jgi:hypothetical protein
MKKKTTLPYMNELSGNRMTLQDAAKHVCWIINKTLPAQYVNTSTGDPISFEDVVTVICTKFVQQHRELLNKVYWEEKTDTWKMPYLKMSYAKRRKISEKVTKTLWR